VGFEGEGDAVPSGLFDAPGELGLAAGPGFSQGFFRLEINAGQRGDVGRAEALGVFEGADEGVAGLAAASGLG